MSIRTINLALTTIALLAVLAGGYAVSTRLEDISWTVARFHTQEVAEMVAKKLDDHVHRSQATATALATEPELVKLFEGAPPGQATATSRILQRFCAALEASLCYLMDGQGVTVAASNFDTEHSLIGNNYGFRPYFKEAIRGQPTVYLALGVTTKKRGIYFSAPVFSGAVHPVGVLVIKFPTAPLEQEFSNSNGVILLADPNGIVFASNRQEWLFKSQRTLSAPDARSVIASRQFGDNAPEPIGLMKSGDDVLTAPDGAEYMYHTAQLQTLKGWSIRYLFDAANVRDLLGKGLAGVSTQKALIALFLLILLIVVVLYTRAAKAIGTRIAAEADLRESEEKYRLLFEQSEDPMWVIYDNVFMVANEAAARILGYASVSELIGVHPSKLSPEHQPDGETSFIKANRMIAEAYAWGYRRFEWDHQRRNGEVFPVEVTLTRIPFAGRDALYCVWRDISDAKESRQALELAKATAEQANQAKSEFLASMSHELRTPLNAILGFSQMLKAEAFGRHSDPKYLEYAGHIERSGEHLLSIINDVLDLSKIEAGELTVNPTKFNLHDAVEECVRLFNTPPRTGQGRIDIDFGAGTEEIFADPRLFRQILLNILSNSDKYTPPEGRIFVRTETRSPGQLAVSIVDEGIGIPPEELAKVLEPFGQARKNVEVAHQGTGLGLPIAIRLMRLQGGELVIGSTPSKGTIVTLLFPA